MVVLGKNFGNSRTRSSKIAKVARYPPPDFHAHARAPHRTNRARGNAGLRVRALRGSERGDMTQKLKPWAKMPSGWITSDTLKSFRWKRGEGANNLAALMLYLPLLHRADPDTGHGSQTYDALCEATSLSRAKVARGLGILEERGLVERNGAGRRSYQISGYDPKAGWAKMPEKGLYLGSSIAAFTHFHLRMQSELNALKLYYLFAARRDNKSNLAHITYEQIEEQAKLSQAHIKAGLSLLAVHGLVHIERMPSALSEYGVANAYRLAHIHSHHHMGTSGRRFLDEGFE